MRVRVLAALAIACSGALVNDAQARPRDSAAYADFLAGSYARRQRDPVEAMARLQDALRSSPGDAMLLQSAAEAALEAGDVTRAARFGREARARNIESGPGGLAMGALSLRQGDSAGARKALANLSGDQTEALCARVIELWAQVEAGDAKGALARLDSDPPSTAPGWRALQLYVRAMVLDAAGRFDDAAAAYAEGERQPALHIAQISLRHGALLAGRGKRDEALALYLNSLARVENPGMRAAFETLQRDARQTAVLKPLRATTGASLSLFALGILLNQMAEGAALQAPLALSAALDPDFEGARFALADMMREDGNEQAVRRTLDRIPRTSPYFETARVQSAMSLYRDGRDEDAVAAMRRLVDAGSGKVALKGLADLYRMQGRYAEAAQIYARLAGDAATASEKDWRLYFALGASLERAGRWAEAEGALKRALELEPGQPDVLNYLGYHWVDSGENLKEGLALLEQAAAQRPDDGAILDSLGWAQFRLGQFDQAVEILEQAVTISPADETVNDHLGDVYWRLNRRIEARYQWQRVLGLKPGNDERRAIEAKLQSGLPAAP